LPLKKQFRLGLRRDSVLLGNLQNVFGRKTLAFAVVLQGDGNIAGDRSWAYPN
jgi:hypothetical protein